MGKGDGEGDRHTDTTWELKERYTWEDLHGCFGEGDFHEIDGFQDTRYDIKTWDYLVVAMF